MVSTRPSLLLNGFMGTGKTTVGRVVAQRVGVPFLDVDEAIEAASGRSIATIFAEEGESVFRAMETSQVLQVLDDPAPRVIALGGGALLDPGSRRAALERTHVVTLMARSETIAERIAGSTRPLLTSVPDKVARIRELLSARTAEYAEAHTRVWTDDRTPEEIADGIIRAWADPTLVVRLGARSYPVRLTSDPAHAVADVLASLASSSTFVITDENVNRHWGASFRAALAERNIHPAVSIVLIPGEQHKHLSAVERALGAMIGAGADRRSVILAHGGGVVTDIAGFAAATLLRGVRWMALPTTLLGMVDASVGGKTGVDLGAAKNAIGAFHQPSAVIVDSSRTSTEGARAYTSGLAEVVKAACVGDPLLFDLLEREADAICARRSLAVDEMVLRALAVKVSIVSRDEREAGERALLNFGHTLGHALEAQGAFQRLTHGEAVSLGMVAMLRAGCALGITGHDVATRVTRLLGRLGLPIDLSREPVEKAIPLLIHDKKRRAELIRVVFLRSIGEPTLREFAVDDLADLLVRFASY